jgi:hypothetical protein
MTDGISPQALKDRVPYVFKVIDSADHRGDHRQRCL